MRLIDADALDYELGTSDRDIYVRECLAEAPSVVVEPHWIPVTEKLPSAQPTFDARDTQYNLPIGTDCISRQAAIDTEGLDVEIRCEMCKNPMHTDRGCDGHCKYDEKLYERIMQILDERIKPLPSAQPEPCEDAVSRKTILKFLDDWTSALEDNVHNQSASDLKIIKKDFENLPSAQPELKTGKWIKTARWRNVYKCDQCGNYLDFSGVNAGRGDANFCPNCGAKMEVTE